MTEEMYTQCETCIFWTGIREIPHGHTKSYPGSTYPGTLGECRRRSPEAIPNGRRFPLVKASDFCGEWRSYSLPLVNNDGTIQENPRL